MGLLEVTSRRSRRRTRRAARALARRKTVVVKTAPVPTKTTPVPATKPTAPTPSASPTTPVKTTPTSTPTSSPTPNPTSVPSSNPTSTPSSTPTSTPTSTPSTPSATLTPAGERHLLRRFSTGLTPALTAEAAAAGGARAWFVQQLDPASVPDPRGDEVDSWFAFTRRTPDEIAARDKAGMESGYQVMVDFSRWTTARRLESSHTVHEVMVDFWSNHFNVCSFSDASWTRSDYDKTIRTHALGTFENLLQAAVTHPALGIFLNNSGSTKTAPNENLGRELLELHTVGVAAGYTEAEVKSSARILTGWRVDVYPAYKAWYDSSRHWTGPVSVLGFSSANASADGRAVTMAYLSHLAKHPATARHIARRLCTKFVSDSPSDSIVNAVASAFTANGTAIAPTLLAMIDHPDFAEAVRTKLRDPQDDWVATVRALGIHVQKPTSEGSYVNAMHYQYLGLGATPFAWKRPDGYPITNGPWAGAGRMLNSFNMHRGMAGHLWSMAETVVPDLATFLPPLPATLQQVIDAVGTALVGEPPGASVSNAVASSLGWSLSQRLTAKDLAGYWSLTTIAGTVLDSPLHMYR